MKRQSSKSANRLKPTQRLSLFFFRRPRRTAIIWLLVMTMGIASYATLLKREGFPSVNTPFAIGQGSYIVNDPAKVDNDVVKPLNAFLIKQDGVKNVQSQSFANFYTAAVSYKNNVNSTTRSAELQKAIEASNVLPDHATIKLDAYKFGFTTRGDDIVISYYSSPGTISTEQLVAKAKQAVTYLKNQHLSLVKDVSVIDPFETAVNPLTGQAELTQKTFDRFGQRQSNGFGFYTTVVIGVQAQPGADNIELANQVSQALAKLNSQPKFHGYTGVVSASYAPQIKAQISELQRALLEGLTAILIVGSIIIAVRASIITVLSMITVIATVNAIMYFIGYSLNTITLFALILGLALIVDDTIIMVEAIDAQRRRQTDPTKAVSVATGKISRAMIAATSTAVLSFAPLIFVGGILGGFIRAIPITIIIALAVSLTVALVFIPLFARFLMLGKKQMGNQHDEIAAGVEAKIARFISAPMLWAKHSRKKLFGIGIGAVLIGIGFIVAGVFLFSRVTFNIFPPSKDSNQLAVTLTFPSNTSLEQAEKTTDDADKIVGQTLGVNFVKASYYGQASIQNATLQVDLTDYSQRSVTSPQLVKQLKQAFSKFGEASVEVNQLDVGPPGSVFTAQVYSDTNRQAAEKLANDITAYLKTATLKRTDGSIAKISSVSVSNSSIYDRKDKHQYIEVTAKYVDTDTTTLLDITKKALQKEFPASRVESYGLSGNSLNYDFGQESENQDSFKTLVVAFPLLLVAIYVLLAFQFRSLLQPLLIFMAIPFSLFGITLSLYLSKNAFSFFAALGFFALIGLSLKNTILLTDYANQSRRNGMDAIDAAHEALAERFRPLIATSLTAVASLIPLAMMSPFWEGLALVLVGGLLSSTFLVLTVFPYYYLGSEYLRSRISRKKGLSWTVLTILLAAGLSRLGPVAWLAPFVAFGLIKLVILSRRKSTG